MLRGRLQLGPRRVRVALLITLALLGFAAAYPLTSGSLAALAGTTTVPSPDLPPPTTPTKPKRPPPPPPPPPPAAPVRSYVAPPPPPAPITSRRRANVAPKPKPVHRRPHVHRSRVKPRQAIGQATAAATPQAPEAGVSVTPLPVASALAAPEGGNSGALDLFFGAALGFLLLGVALTAAPRAVLPGRVSELVELHRDVVLTLLCALALGLATGLFLGALS
jgi:hypothetical protein